MSLFGLYIDEVSHYVERFNGLGYKYYYMLMIFCSSVTLRGHDKDIKMP